MRDTDFPVADVDRLGACYVTDPAGERFVFEVRPVKVLAFAKGDFTQTRYRFAG